jgi:HAT1-interacting factor 1
MSAQEQTEQQSTTTTTTTDSPATVSDALDHAKRAFALRKHEQAVEHYATALELLSKTHAEDAPEMADVYVAYGRALLENAIAQSSVLGKEQQQQQEGDAAAEEPAPNGNKILSFSGDAEDEEDGDDHDDHDPAVDLFAEASKPDVEGEGEEEAGEGADEAEPEDDFNAAWEVLEMARAIYE